MDSGRRALAIDKARPFIRVLLYLTLSEVWIIGPLENQDMIPSLRGVSDAMSKVLLWMSHTCGNEMLCMNALAIKFSPPHMMLSACNHQIHRHLAAVKEPLDNLDHFLRPSWLITARVPATTYLSP